MIKIIQIAYKGEEKFDKNRPCSASADCVHCASRLSAVDGKTEIEALGLLFQELINKHTRISFSDDTCEVLIEIYQDADDK